MQVGDWHCKQRETNPEHKNDRDGILGEMGTKAKAGCSGTSLSLTSCWWLTVAELLADGVEDCSLLRVSVAG